MSKNVPSEEVVAAAYPFNNSWGRFAGTPLIELKDGVPQYASFRSLSDGSHVLEAQMIAGGFMRLKRSAVVKFAKAYPESIYTDSFAWPPKPDRIYTAFFQCDIHNYERYGEDAYFCRKMREVGVKLWSDPNVTIIHYGVQGYPGNYHEHLVTEKQRADAATTGTTLTTCCTCSWASLQSLSACPSSLTFYAPRAGSPAVGRRPGAGQAPPGCRGAPAAGSPGRARRWTRATPQGPRTSGPPGSPGRRCSRRC